MESEFPPICEKWLQDILQEKWKESNQAHPSTMLARDTTQPDTRWSENKLDVLNGFHAYCLACKIHIYSRSDPSDEFSYFAIHSNNPGHRLKVSLVPHCRPMLIVQESAGSKKKLTCSACNSDVPPVTLIEKATLETLIKKHVMSLQHKYNAFTMEDKKMSFLISMARIPKIRYMLLPKYKENNFMAFCKLCEKNIWEEDEKHLETKAHLQNVGKFLEAQFKFNVKDAEDEDKLRDLLAKVAWFSDLDQKKKPETLPSNREQGQVKSQVFYRRNQEASCSDSFEKTLKEAVKSLEISSTNNGVGGRRVQVKRNN